LVTAARERPEQAARMIAGWGLGRAGRLGGGGLPGASLSGGVQAILGTTPPGVLHAGLAACAAYEGGLVAAAGITCPTLVLVGAEDRMAPPRRGRELAAAIAGAEVQLIAGAGHMLMLEAADAVTTALLRFLGPLSDRR
jgi:pimeloyl-ACP methyl ester carboxylesterase